MVLRLEPQDLERNEVVYPLLIKTAKEAAQQSYSPYSKFKVGAALLAEDGRIFTGCNVENAAYGPTICAERTAIVKAVSEGARRFKAIGVVCESAPGSWPCGLCRQVISEFGDNITIVVDSADGKISTASIAEILPHIFRLATV
jgi:cytidine deaminase